MAFRILFATLGTAASNHLLAAVAAPRMYNRGPLLTPKNYSRAQLTHHQCMMNRKTETPAEGDIAEGQVEPTITMNRDQLALIRKFDYYYAKAAPIVSRLDILIGEPPAADFMRKSQQAQALRIKAAQITCLLPEISEVVDRLTLEATAHEELDELQQRCDEFNDFYTTAKMAVAAAEAIALDLVTSQAAPPISASHHQSFAVPVANAVSNTTKLPKQTLPRFDGDVMKFRSFWQQFEASVDRNTSLTNVQKLNYLLPLLENDAKKSVEGLDLNDSAYPIAVNILKTRYGDNNTIIRTLHNRMANLPICENNHEELEKFLNELEAISRSLKSLGNPLDGQFVATHVYARLPADFCEKLSRSKKLEDPWTVDLLLEKFLYEVKMKKDCADGKLTTSDAFGSRSPPHIASGEALVAHQRQDPGSSKIQYNRQNFSRSQTESFSRGSPQRQADFRRPYCQLCQRYDDHFVSDCKEYPTAQTRHEQAMKLRLCLNCLKAGHIFKECRSRSSCYNCRQTGHHSGLCRKTFSGYQYNRVRDASNWRTPPNAQRTRMTYARSRTALVADSNEDYGQTSDAVEQNDEADPDRDNHTLLTTQVPQHGKAALSQSGDSVVTLLQSARAIAKNGKKSQMIRLLLDTCSNRTFITTKLAKSLGLSLMEGQPLEVNVFGSSQAKTILTKTTEITLQTRDDESLKMNATVLPSITGHYKREAINCNALRLISRRLELADHMPDREESVEIDMLVGNDYYADIVLGPRKRVEDSLYLLQSRLGWVLAGRADPGSVASRSHVMTGITLKCHATTSETPQKELAVNAYPYLSKPPCLSDLWSLDTLGITDEPNKKEQEDEEAMAQFKQSVRIENGRYVARFPWIEEKVDQLPGNYDAAAKRLRTLIKRLHERPELLRKYDDIIQEQLRTNITEVVDLEQEPKGPVNYLPHREIEKPDKETTKVRIVYDASCRQNQKGLSLNDCMRRGPVFLENLSGILLRFRLSPIALVADIEKAFHQVVLDERDRDATRFLWLRDIKGPVAAENIIVLRFQRVLFGARASPMLLEATIDHHLTTKHSETCEKVNGNIYMDNLVSGESSTEDALRFYHETKSVFAEIGMNMREWTSNSREFMQRIPEKDRCRPENVKILGIEWMTTTDQFCFNVPKKSLIDVRTKRDLVSAVAAVFDPNGLILPYTLKGKILLQKVDQLVQQWEKPVPESILSEWSQFLDQLKQLSEMCIPRYLSQASNEKATYQLHCFTDASDKCYAAAVFLRIAQSSVVSVQLVFAKGRVKPVKKLTIPRLELMGVLIGVRALNYVTRELRLNIESRYLWSDSSCVLQWLRSMRDLGRFVNNRVKEIRQSTDISFRFVPSKDNVADIPTRTMEMTTIPDRWFAGPEWLKSFEKDWPKTQFKEGAENLNKTEATVCTVPINPDTGCQLVPPFGISSEKFSSLSKLLRVTDWCQRFVSKLKKTNLTFPTWLTAEEVNSAEVKWIKHEQAIAGYTRNYENKKGSQERLVRKLGVFQDDQGIVRSRGRFGHSSLPYITKYPALLPKHGQFTKLAIERAHKEIMHGGTAHTLARLRSRYWITGGKNNVRNTISRCVVCRRYEGHPFKMQVMPDLPAERATPGVAFENVGLDYFGPLYVKKPVPDAGLSKVWCALFVCLKVRAVHIEMVDDMTTASFLLAFRRFVTRYGKPTTIVSDHASQFELADAVLQKLWMAVEQDKDLHNYWSMQGIQWRKITQYAPWQGGVYERLVKTVKRPLRKVLQQKALTSDQMRTVLYEVAAVVNSRPLIANPASDNEFSISDVLTPSHFLHPHPKTGVPYHTQTESIPNPNTTKDALIQDWKKGSKLLDDYWELWLNMYLPGLREQQTFYHEQSKKAIKRPPEVGEVVIIHDQDHKRGAWKTGQIQQLIKSSDGLVRSAKVKLSSRKLIQRAINHLYPLECRQTRSSSTQDHCQAQSNTSTTTSIQDTTTPPASKNATTTTPIKTADPQSMRPQRDAARRALAQMKGQA